MVTVGCQQEEKARPPALASDDGFSGGPIAAGTSRGGADGSTTGPSSPAADASGKLTKFEDDAFRAVSEYLEPVNIYVIDEKGLDFTLGEGGDGTFSVPGVEPRADTWILVEPVTDKSSMATLSVHDSRTGALRVPLVPINVLQGVLSTIQSDPTTPSSIAAQLLLRIVDGAGQPVKGVKIFVQGGPDITYATADTWGEFRDNTDSNGLALVYNMPARSRPGQEFTISLSGSVDKEVDARVIAGAITVLTINVDP